MLRCTVPSILLRRYLARDRGRNCLRCHKTCPASQPCGIMRVRGRQRRLSPGYPRHGLCAAHPLERCQEAGVSCFNRHSLLEEGRGIRGWGYSPSRQRENVTQHRERAFYSGPDETTRLPFYDPRRAHQRGLPDRVMGIEPWRGDDEVVE